MKTIKLSNKKEDVYISSFRDRRKQLIEAVQGKYKIRKEGRGYLLSHPDKKPLNNLPEVWQDRCRAVEQKIAQGLHTCKEIVENIGLSESPVYFRLRLLREAGRIDKDDHTYTIKQKNVREYIEEVAKLSGRSGEELVRSFIKDHLEEFCSSSYTFGSDLEEEFYLRLRKKYIGKIIPQYTVGKYRVDFYLPEEETIIEIDGSQHLEKEHYVADRERDWLLQEAGYKVLRILSYKFVSSGEIQIDKIDEIIDSVFNVN